MVLLDVISILSLDKSVKGYGSVLTISFEQRQIDQYLAVLADPTSN